MASVKKIWDNYITVGEVQKSDAIKLVVSAATRDGVRYINIREFYKRKKDECWMPGRDGITFPLVVPINKGTTRLEPFIKMAELLVTAGDVARNMTLADDAGAVYITREDK